ncbi:MAG: hypothetical protein ACC631_04220 [Halocynthiibacter sp.]
MNANLIFKWLKEPRFAPVCEETGAVFLPVEIEPTVPALSSPPVKPDSRIEIELAGGHRISAEGGFDPDALVRLLQGLLS